MSANKEADVKNYEQVTIYENQRWWVGKGWVKTTKYPNFCDKDGKQTPELEDQSLPEGWEWFTKWHVNVTDQTSTNGWLYGFSFGSVPLMDMAESSVGRVVRTRQWIRSRKQINSPSLTIPVQSKIRIGLFFNAKSGGGMGLKLFNRFQVQHTDEAHVLVHNLSNGGPEAVLRELIWGDSKATAASFAIQQATSAENFPHVEVRVLACGGDGTGAWLYEVIDKLVTEAKLVSPEFAEGFIIPGLMMLPMGTGNDLARVSGMGGTFEDDHKNVSELAKLLLNAKRQQFDRWNVEISNSDPKPSSSDTKSDDQVEQEREKDEKQESKVLKKTLNNYLGYGVVADTALAFHNQREAAGPNASQSQLGNVMIYGILGTTRTFTRPYSNIHTFLKVFVDEKEIDLKKHKLSDIEILNIPSFSGGCDMWGSENDGLKSMAFDDGIIELIGIESSFHVAECRTGLTHGIRLAQGSRIKILTTDTCPLQLDGEAWMQEPGEMNISFKCKSVLLIPNDAKDSD